MRTCSYVHMDRCGLQSSIYYGTALIIIVHQLTQAGPLAAPSHGTRRTHKPIHLRVHTRALGLRVHAHICHVIVAVQKQAKDATEDREEVEKGAFVVHMCDHDMTMTYVHVGLGLCICLQARTGVHVCKKGTPGGACARVRACM